eukprot:CAMPEP_0197027980 /NCGR_PEP_ID=MMETSP1384-20130603/7813_1 /TAXON_ID=29189 /ORGANISM="Ammonia sp." /LENGTH=369 /DNA_ID=CAMNT_0042456915 /DNA_START=57 /DNA_END=1166 /DNA_ORIENTATION=+
MAQFCLFWLALITSLFYLYPSNAVSDEVLTQAQDKLDDLLAKSSAGSSGKKGFVEIAGSDFEKFITRGPRPYYALVVLTAMSSGNCQPCEQLNPSIEELAKIVEEQRDKITRGDASSLFADNSNTDIFVLNADFANNRGVFQKLGLSTAPTLVLVPPSKTKKEIPLSKFFKSIPTKYHYSLTTGRSAEEIGNWIINTAKTSWLQFGSKMELPRIQYIVAFILFVPILLYVGRKIIDKLRRSMIIYALVCMVAYSFIIGGGMFSSIRSTPWLHKEGNKIGYISHMSRYQFGVETYIVGGFNFLAGVGAFVFIMAQRSDQAQIRNHRFFKVFKFVPTFIPLIAMIAGWYGIMWCYNFKNQHYNFGHVGMTG